MPRLTAQQKRLIEPLATREVKRIYEASYTTLWGSKYTNKIAARTEIEVARVLREQLHADVIEKIVLLDIGSIYA